MNEVEQYIDAQDPRAQALLQQVRQIVLELIPDGVEAISYQIPAIRLHPTAKKKNNVLHYAAFKNHISLFPRSHAVDQIMGEAILQYCAGKGTLQFPLNKELPTDIVREFVKIRLREASSTKPCP